MDADMEHQAAEGYEKIDPNQVTNLFPEHGKPLVLAGFVRQEREMFRFYNLPSLFCQREIKWSFLSFWALMSLRDVSRGMNM